MQEQRSCERAETSDFLPPALTPTRPAAKQSALSTVVQGMGDLHDEAFPKRRLGYQDEIAFLVQHPLDAFQLFRPSFEPTSHQNDAVNDLYLLLAFVLSLLRLYQLLFLAFALSLLRSYHVLLSLRAGVRQSPLQLKELPLERLHWGITRW